MRTFLDLLDSEPWPWLYLSRTSILTSLRNIVSQTRIDLESWGVPHESGVA